MKKKLLKQEIVRINLFYPNGSKVEIQAEIGENLLIAFHRHQVDIRANCGGFCSCRTCHVYIQEEYFKSIPELYTVSDEELDLLENTYAVRFNSRLACQIIINRDMHNMNIYIEANSCWRHKN